MGGRGSGNWYRWDKMSSIEEFQRLDIRQISKRKLLKPGYSFSWGWSIDGKHCGDIWIRIKEQHLVLIYKTRRSGDEWKSVEEMVFFSRSDCNYGGTRPWFICPGCGRRIAVLVAAGTYFLCRHCYRLSYASQNETELDRMYRKTRKIRARLGEKEWLKPKGMHRKTFDRIRGQLHEAIEMENMAFIDMGRRKFGIYFEELV